MPVALGSFLGQRGKSSFSDHIMLPWCWARKNMLSPSASTTGRWSKGRSQALHPLSPGMVFIVLRKLCS